MTWLITGGAGYIGAHVARALRASGRDVVLVDDLSTGLEGRVTGLPLVRADVADTARLTGVLREHGVTGVVHLAAKKQVAESVAEPLRYYRENVGGLVSVLEACRAADVARLVFSSSAAVYGMPDAELVDEDAPTAPLSPYGETKLVGEWLVRGAGAASGLAHTSLRYFNVAGAASPELGDRGAANLIPLVFTALDAGRRPVVLGTDHPTPDGTCIRDYVHVADLAAAHVLAAGALERGDRCSPVYNVGTGGGASVLDVLDVVARVTGMDTGYRAAPPRAGDAARVVAAVDRIRDELGFVAEHDLESMVASAWAAWQRR